MKKHALFMILFGCFVGIKNVQALYPNQATLHVTAVVEVVREISGSNMQIDSKVVKSDTQNATMGESNEVDLYLKENSTEYAADARQVGFVRVGNGTLKPEELSGAGSVHVLTNMADTTKKIETAFDLVQDPKDEKKVLVKVAYVRHPEGSDKDIDAGSYFGTLTLSTTAQ